jgi:hypothetical protein
MAGSVRRMLDEGAGGIDVLRDMLGVYDSDSNVARLARTTVALYTATADNLALLPLLRPTSSDDTRSRTALTNRSTRDDAASDRSLTEDRTVSSTRVALSWSTPNARVEWLTLTRSLPPSRPSGVGAHGESRCSRLATGRTERRTGH